MKSLAVIVSRGSLNSLVQVATLLMTAVGSGVAVRVFFRDEAIFAIARGAPAPRLSDLYHGKEAHVLAELERQALAGLPDLFRQIKDVGDARLYACSSSLAICGVKPDELLPEIDGVRGITAFLIDDMATADHVLTF